MLRRPPCSTRTDTLFPHTSSSDLPRRFKLEHLRGKRSLLLQFGIHGQQRCGRYLNVGAEIRRRLGLLLKAFGNLSRFFVIGPQRCSGAISGHCGFAKLDVAALEEDADRFLCMSFTAVIEETLTRRLPAGPDRNRRARTSTSQN